MVILSHRGYWKDARKNSVDAFKASFVREFGTETDIRDYNGELVISHDCSGPLICSGLTNLDTKIAL